MDQVSFGDLLRAERERKRFSIDHVSHDLKIRARIIEAFEEGDFEAFPPEGYAQGMISSYARYLGLDPAEVIDLYRDELAEHYAEEDVDWAYPRGSSGGGPYSPGRTPRSNAAQKGKGGASRSKQSRPYGAPRETVALGDAKHELPWKRMLVIAAIVLVVGLGIWGIFSLLTKDKQDVPPPNVQKEQSSNTTDTPTPSAEETAGAQGSVDTSNTPNAPFTIEIDAAQGASSWIQVTVDGKNAYAQTMVGPDSKKFTVSDSIQVTVGKLTGITVKRDGTEIEIPKAKGIGKLDIKASDPVSGPADNPNQNEEE